MILGNRTGSWSKKDGCSLQFGTLLKTNMSNKPSLGLGTKLGAAAVRHGDNKGDLNVNLNKMNKFLSLRYIYKIFFGITLLDL